MSSWPADVQIWIQLPLPNTCTKSKIFHHVNLKSSSVYISYEIHLLKLQLGGGLQEALIALRGHVQGVKAGKQKF